MIATFIIFFISLLIDRVIGSFSLTLPLILIFQIKSKDDRLLSIPLFVGLLVDLFNGFSLGLSSLFLLFLSLLVFIYRNSVSAKTSWSIVFLSIISVLLARWIWQYSWVFYEVVIQVFLTLLLWVIANWWQGRSISGDVFIKND